MEQENNNDIISTIIKMFNLESCFRKNYEPFYNTNVDLSNIETNFNNDMHPLARRRTQFMK
tara:strand:- start:373 stop:555 length:183 start_codon:yes stop_codon:yes gene_type:complete